MRDHGSIGLPLGMGSFGGPFGFCVFLAFSFLVLREANKSPTHRILVGNQREKTTFRSWFPFLSFVHLVTILYCSDIVRSKDLSAHFFCFFDQELSFLPFSSFFTFSHSLIWNFLSFLFAFSLIGSFPSFLFFASEGKVYGESGFWLKACRMARHDTCQGLVWFKDKKGCPILFP